MKIPFEKVVLACAALFVVFLIARYDICFQDSEVLRLDPNALVNGRGYSPKDLVTAFDVGSMEGDARARYVSYFTFIVVLKTRLALWHLFPPHPSFSPVWILTLIAGPLLLFKFLEAELNDRAAAFAGVAVYLTSAGLLSGVTMLFHPAKPLANVLVIAVLYLTARVRRANQRGAGAGPLSRGLLAALLVVAPFVDETAAFAYAIPLVWLPDSSRWRIALVPAACAGVIVFLVPPLFSELPFRDDFGVAGYLWRINEAGVWRFDPFNIVWNAGNLLIPELLPWRVARVATPVVDDVKSLPILALTGITMAFVLLTRAAFRTPGLWPAYRKLLLLCAGYVVFQSLVLLFHPLSLSATGFYYGAIFSVLFSSLAAATYQILKSGRPPSLALARAALVWTVAISAVNFFAINDMWIQHSNTKAEIETFPWYHTIGDWRRLDALRTQVLLPVLPYAPAGGYAPSPDDAQRTARQHFADSKAMWKNWRDGRVDFAANQTITYGQLWLVNELWLLRGVSDTN